MDLKVGDIVKLKTGGPKMTVNRVGPLESTTADDLRLLNNEVEAIWFNKHQAGVSGTDTEGWDFVASQRFGADALDKVAP